MVEIGPQEQSVCRAKIMQEAYDMTQYILAYCQLWNESQSSVSESLPPCEAFRLGKEVKYPLSEEGKPVAMVHPSLQDNDFTLLEKGAPVFLHFDGQETLWDEPPTYPHFINEAAYQHLHVAFATAIKFSL